MSIVGLSLQNIFEADPLTRRYLIGRANQKISTELNKFWTQTIGKGAGLSLHFELENFSHTQSGKEGRPYFEFWVGDGRGAQLYFKQRSLGVRWFISFFLQMQSAKNGAHQIFLLDEPGANLHTRAQLDVIGLINQLGETLDVAYSTHSSTMIEYDKLYRILAVQREDVDGGPTRLITAQDLGSAHEDTLSPILQVMGSKLGDQEAIRTKANVLVEEISGHYYFNAFMHLLNNKNKPSFIAATGVTNLKKLASMFMGWGLEFIAIFDDDDAGKREYRWMRDNYYAESPELAAKSMWLIDGCASIEDVFHPNDFAKFVYKCSEIPANMTNSNYIAEHPKSKPVMAHDFYCAVLEKRVKLSDLKKETVEKIKQIESEINKRLFNA